MKQSLYFINFSQCLCKYVYCHTTPLIYVYNEAVHIEKLFCYKIYTIIGIHIDTDLIQNKILFCQISFFFFCDVLFNKSSIQC